jgi:O-antigen/teichoic acid export membrane protein
MNFLSLHKKVGPLARSTMIVMAWNAARLLVQFMWIVLLARSLGPSGYGLFSGIAGLAISISGLVGLGLGLRLYRDVARDPKTFGLRWAQSIRMMWASAAALASCFIALGRIIFPDAPWSLIASIAIAELIATPLVHLAALAYAAQGRMADAASMPVVLALSRLAAVALLPIVIASPQVGDYAALHLVATCTAAVFLLLRLRRQLRPPRATSELEPGAIKEGVTLAGLWATGLAMSGVDKAAVLHAGNADIAGQYTAAHRLTAIATMPVEALVTTVLPRLFRTRPRSPGTGQLVGGLCLAAASYGSLAGVLLWATAGKIHILLGQGFQEVAPTLQLIALAAPFQCLRLLGANILLGFGQITWRLTVEVIGLALLIGLILVLAPEFGVRGAASAVIVAEATMALAFWGRIIQSR